MRGTCWTGLVVIIDPDEDRPKKEQPKHSLVGKFVRNVTVEAVEAVTKLPQFCSEPYPSAPASLFHWVSATTSVTFQNKKKDQRCNLFTCVYREKIKDLRRECKCGEEQRPAAPHGNVCPNLDIIRERLFLLLLLLSVRALAARVDHLLLNSFRNPKCWRKTQNFGDRSQFFAIC